MVPRRWMAVEDASLINVTASEMNPTKEGCESVNVFQEPTKYDLAGWFAIRFVVTAAGHARCHVCNRTRLKMASQPLRRARDLIGQPYQRLARPQPEPYQNLSRVTRLAERAESAAAQPSRLFRARMAWCGSFCGRKRADAEATSCWWASSCKVIRGLIGCLFACSRGATPPKRIYFGRLTSSPQSLPVSLRLSPPATRTPGPVTAGHQVASLGRVGRARRLALPNLTAVGNASFHSALHEGMPGFDRSARFPAPRLPLLPARRDGDPGP